MRLAVSNIAWPREQDEAVAGVLADLGVTGIEIAPTKVWPNPLDATVVEIDEHRRWWADLGFEIAGAQALLFGRPELTLFESAETRRKTLDYLRGIVRLCSRLGARVLVFGSPKNRRVGDQPSEAVRETAIQFFGSLSQFATDEGACVVLEANPAEYGADFVTTAAEAVALVRAVDHPGFWLHLDTACMTLAGDPVADTFAAGGNLLRHFHVSEPQLAAPGPGGAVDHRAFATALARHGYSGWVSVEMRQPEPFDLGHFAAAVRWVRDQYFGIGLHAPARLAT